MAIFLLSACGPDTEVKSNPIKAYCSVIREPLENHMDSLIDFGEVIIVVGADEVLVTGSELSDVFETACKNK